MEKLRFLGTKAALLTTKLINKLTVNNFRIFIYKSSVNIAGDNAWLVSFHLYVAGTETTATALRWGLLFMCLHPEIQKKVQREIDEELGTIFYICI